MAKGTWRQRFKDLEERIGNGTLQGQIVVNQPYAAYQEVHEHLKHPRGGQAHYTGSSLLENADNYVDNLADGVLDGTLVEKMADNMEDMASEIFKRAPVLYTPLRSSGNPIVRDDGAVKYDRPPLAKRIKQ